jgi:GNAT superfamily N-acetyltransferase
MNREIEKGDTYAYTEPMTIDFFGAYWFSNLVGIMLLGDWGSTVKDCLARLAESVNIEKDWERECLGSFFVKPNYPGRSSHICNGTFLVTDGARNRGVGRLMGEGYLEWAPKLGYSYSVFNLVYETNVASCRIWDALGFKRVGRIKGCGHLKSHDEPIDAIIYGRELSTNSPDDFLAEERFDRIKYYLKHQKYPDGIGRAEKSRLRSAATHYKIVAEEGGTQEEKLFLRDKEVIADPQKQYEITRETHRRQHEGINKTTAKVNEKYHWLRIKETATLVIKNCPECNEPIKRSAGAPNVSSATIPEAIAVRQTRNDEPPVMQQTNNDLQMMMSNMTDITNSQYTNDMASLTQNNEMMAHMATPVTLSAQSSLGLDQQTSLGQLGHQDQFGQQNQLDQQRQSIGIPDLLSQQNQFGQAGQYSQQGESQIQQQQNQQSLIMPGTELPQLMGSMGYDMPVDPQIMAQLQSYEPFLQQTSVDSQMQNTNTGDSADLLGDFKYSMDSNLGGGS